MFSIRSCPLPDGALLAAYADGVTYTDCYTTELAGAVSLADYVRAFYTTPVFRLERHILKWAVSRPSTDAEVRSLAAGSLDTFAAWRVEQRSDNQLLLCDFLGRTRSWLMIAPLISNSGTRTRLYFGSAVVPKKHPGTGQPGYEFGFGALIEFHKLYSVILLNTARTRLEARLP